LDDLKAYNDTNIDKLLENPRGSMPVKKRIDKPIENDEEFKSL